MNYVNVTAFHSLKVVGLPASQAVSHWMVLRGPWELGEDGSFLLDRGLEGRLPSYSWMPWLIHGSLAQ